MTTKTATPARRTAQRRHSRAAFLAGAAAVALAAAACTSTPSPPSSTGTTTTAAAGTTAIGWSACGTGLDCAKVPVPLDWKNPNGTKIELAVIRHRASKSAERIGSLFINPGGPGDTGVGMVRDSGPGLDAWGGGRFDIISWDPRGTHASSPIHCFADDAEEAVFWKGVTIPYTASESAAYATRMLDLARRCGQVMGDVLSHVSTADTARDLDALRQGVGEDKITYVGLSYGTYLGQTYVNMFPQHVRAMMPTRRRPRPLHHQRRDESGQRRILRRRGGRAVLQAV